MPALGGLAALAGSSPNVGVAGYTLGGGLGWVARRSGLAANSVTAAELSPRTVIWSAPTPATSRTHSGRSAAPPAPLVDSVKPGVIRVGS